VSLVDLPALAPSCRIGVVSARAICGVLHCDELLFNPALKSLPPLLVAWPAPETEAALLVAAIRRLVEAGEGSQAGGACLRARLAELLLVEVLRGHLAALSPLAPGWLGAVNDPLVGGALQQLHARPRERWTVARLARQVGASRSRLGARFTALVGDPPMRYPLAAAAGHADAAGGPGRPRRHRRGGWLRVGGGVQPGVQAPRRRAARGLAGLADPAGSWRLACDHDIVCWFLVV
jgi:hypothetical protein